MASAWDTAGTLPVRPPDDLDDHDVVVTGPGRYWECGLSKWHLMLGWFAGPQTLMRYPDTRERHHEVIAVDAAGGREISHRAATAAEMRADHEDLNEHLRRRGLPELPGGFRWFQLVPPGGSGRDVVDAYLAVQRDLPARSDVDLETAYARAAVEELYGLAVTPPPPIPPGAGPPAPAESPTPDPMTGPPGAVPILRCRSLERSLPFYASIGFRAEQLSGYAILRTGSAELHLSQTSSAAPGGCLIRVPDAAALWHQMQGQETLGPLEHDRFTLLDPDNNHLIFIGTT